MGKFLTLENLGILTSIAFLASFPLLLGLAVTSRIMIPIYRERSEVTHKLVKMRYALTAAVLWLLLSMAMVGPWQVNFLYDARYVSAGAIVTKVCIALIPQVIGMTNDQAALAAGRLGGFSSIQPSVRRCGSACG